MIKQGIYKIFWLIFIILSAGIYCDDPKTGTVEVIISGLKNGDLGGGMGGNCKSGFLNDCADSSSVDFTKKADGTYTKKEAGIGNWHFGCVNVIIGNQEQVINYYDAYQNLKTGEQTAILKEGGKITFNCDYLENGYLEAVVSGTLTDELYAVPGSEIILQYSDSSVGIFTVDDIAANRRQAIKPGTYEFLCTDSITVGNNEYLPMPVDSVEIVSGEVATVVCDYFLIEFFKRQ